MKNNQWYQILNEGRKLREAVPPTPLTSQQQPPAPEAAPSPDSGGEYDFTPDFQEYENEVNSSTQAAKEKFEGKMNAKLLNKKIEVTASRGFGQPAKEHTIEKVKKATVRNEYFKGNKVILKDDKDKEYFLTPGMKIKIMSSAPAHEESPSPENPEAVPAQPETPPQEVPAENPPAEAPESPPPAAPPQQPEVAPQPPAPAPEAPKPETTDEVPSPEDEEEKKRKAQQAPVMENRILNKFFNEFMKEHVKDPITEKIDYSSYIKSKPVICENFMTGNKYKKYTLEIPSKDLVENFDIRDIKLSAKMNNTGIDMVKSGRFYLMELTK